MSDAAQVIRDWLAEEGLEFEEPSPGRLTFALPGTRKLQTPVRVDIGRQVVGISAFVCRRPDEHHERVYRWLLERNLKTFGVAFAVDAMGDIYLDGRLPLAAITPEALDQVMGALLHTADESFNTLLELGFASSIRKEWEWRLAHGESTRNLDAFRGWLERDAPPASAQEQDDEGDDRRS